MDYEYMDYDDQHSFILACKYGHLDRAKELYEEGEVDISAEDESAFCYACAQGHLEVAKWLLEKKPDIDISADYDWAFRWSCWHGHLEVAEWLQSLCPEKYPEIYPKKYLFYNEYY